MNSPYELPNLQPNLQPRLQPEPTGPGSPAPLTDDPRHIGVSHARSAARRLVLGQGQGQFVDDIALPRLAHVVYWRSQVAHCRIGAINASAVRAMPGVLGVFTGTDVARLCKPWVATLAHLAGIKSAPEYALAMDRAHWQGEPVVAGVAQSGVQAEDALRHLVVEWDELPAVLATETALAPGTPVIHPELGDNLCFERHLDTGGVDEAFARADAVFEETYVFGRHTGVPLEPRCQIAD